MSAAKNNIITTGDQLRAKFWMSWTIEVCTPPDALVVARGACELASRAWASREGGALNTCCRAAVTPALSRSSASTILGISTSMARQRAFLGCAGSGGAAGGSGGAVGGSGGAVGAQHARRQVGEEVGGKLQVAHVDPLVGSVDQ